MNLKDDCSQAYGVYEAFKKAICPSATYLTLLQSLSKSIL